MLGVIGVKRLTILITLIVLNVFIAAITYLYILPESYSTTQRARTLKGEVSTVQADLDKILIEFEQLGTEQKDFEALKESGFFKLQTRNEAKDLFKAIQNESGVISAVASVRSGQIEENEEAQKAKHKILASKIDVDIRAFDDTHIYKYIALAQQNFMGHLSLDSIQIMRMGDVTPSVLRSISMGKNPELITAKLVMTWRTMIPEDQVILDETLQ